MNRTYEEWLKYYENATKEQVIEDLTIETELIFTPNSLTNNRENIDTILLEVSNFIKNI